VAQAQAMMLDKGKLYYHSKAMAKAAMQKNFSANPLARGWTYWKVRAQKAMPDIADI
jgi:hypothetical protein